MAKLRALPNRHGPKRRSFLPVRFDAGCAGGMDPSPAIEIASDRLRLYRDGRIEKIPVE